MQYKYTTDFMELTRAFWLQFYIDGAGTEWFDIGLPTPTYLHHARSGYFLAYAIDGYFGTKKGQEYLLDLVTRFLATMVVEGVGVERLGYRPYFEDRQFNAHFFPAIYSLSALSKALPYRALDMRPSAKKQAEALAALYCYSGKTEDALFDAIRFPFYDFVRANGKSCLTLEYVETIAEIAYERIGSKKGWSTAKSKAKAVYNWVMEFYNPNGSGINNWNYVPKFKGNPEKERELKMTRIERAKTNAATKEQNTREKIRLFLNTFDALDCRKKNGKWNISKIAKKLGMKPQTVSKHLKALSET
jgi:hypothetical protein